MVMQTLPGLGYDLDRLICRQLTLDTACWLYFDISTYRFFHLRQPSLFGKRIFSGNASDYSNTCPQSLVRIPWQIGSIYFDSHDPLRSSR
jgi:hypothetical protein